jgi:hypothetical protein
MRWMKNTWKMNDDDQRRRQIARRLVQELANYA